MKIIPALVLGVFALGIGDSALAASINGCTIGPAVLCVERDLRGANLRNANLARADFSRSDLSGADLGDANLRSADLDGAKFNRANLARANLERADLKRAALSGANLRGARLTGASLHSADLNGATLDGALLDGANLSGAHLPGSALRRASLQRADLTGALLSHADLRGANLTGANLRNATLTGADLTGARLTEAVFDGASMQGCTGCPPAAAGSPGTVAPESRDASTPTVSAVTFGSGCWARIYRQALFNGEPVTLVGPVDVPNVRSDWGFEWDPQFKSMIVGPKATLTVYDNINFRDTTARFTPGQTFPDLDRQMGTFRTIRSIRIECSK